MSCVAAPSGLDDRPSAPVAPWWPRPSGRKNAHRGLAACQRTASGQPCSQALIASGKSRRSPTTARRSHLLQQTNAPPNNPQPTSQPNSPQQSTSPPSDNQPNPAPEPEGNPCGCGDAGQRAIDEWDSEESHLQDAADALARGDLAEYEADMNLAAINGAAYDRDVATAQGVHSGQ